MVTQWKISMVCGDHVERKDHGCIDIPYLSFTHDRTDQESSAPLFSQFYENRTSFSSVRECVCTL